MSPREPARDREIREALQQLYPPPSPERLRVLSRRIERRARPLLAARRRQPLTWWEYPAAWASTLLPLGLATALAAAACLLWISSDRREPSKSLRAMSPERVALLQAATRRSSAPELLDLVLSPSEEVSAPVSVHVSRP